MLFILKKEEGRKEEREEEKEEGKAACIRQQCLLALCASRWRSSMFCARSSLPHPGGRRNILPASAAPHAVPCKCYIRGTYRYLRATWNMRAAREIYSIKHLSCIA